MHLAPIIRTQEYYDLIKSSILLVFSTMGLIYLKFVWNLIKLSSVPKISSSTGHFAYNNKPLSEKQDVFGTKDSD